MIDSHTIARVKELRARNYTYATIGAELGISTTTVHRLDNGLSLNQGKY